MAGKIIVTYTPGQFDREKVLEEVLTRMQKGFDSIVGPHIAEAAQAKTRAMSVGKIDRFNPRQKGSKSFQSVDLIDKVAPGRGIGPKIQRLASLRAGETEVNLDTDAEFFVIRDKDPRGRPQRDAGKPAEIIAFRKGVVVGAARHTPGNLSKSIRYEGSKRDGKMVVGTVRASAEYAAAIHDGFTHKGGRKHDGKSTEVTGRPYLVEAMELAESDAFNASTYEAK